MLAIYARISKDKEETDRSIDDQIETGIELAKNNRLEYEVYREADGTSGSLLIEKRPELHRLVQDIIDNKITHVFAFDQSRLERNTDVRYVLSRLFKEKKIKVYFQSGLRGENLENDLLGDLMSRLNQYYLEITSLKIKSVLNRNAKEGRRFSFLQFGYAEGEDKKLIINDIESEIVKQIFSLSLEGKGTEKIAEILNEAGVPTRYNQKEGTYKVKNQYTKEVTIRQKKDVKWKGGTIRGIITNPIYKGERRWNDEVYPAPAILDAWYWQKVNDNLKNNSNNRGKKVEHSYLLKGLLRCGKCGSNYYGRTRVAKDGKKPKDNYYMCSSKRRGKESCGNRSINIEALDNLVWMHLFLGGGMVQIFHNFLNSGAVNEELERLKKDIELKANKVEAIDFQRSKIVEAIGLDVLSIEEARPNIERLRNEKIILENELRNLEIQQDEIINSQVAFEGTKKLSSVWKENSIEEKRELINEFIKNIIINNVKDIGCEVTIQFVSFGLKDEVYHISTNNKWATNKPANPHNDSFEEKKWNEETKQFESTGRMVEVEYYSEGKIQLKE